MRKELLLCIFCALFAYSQATVPDAVKDSLVEFYDATNGADWTVATNWGTGDPCDDSWFGITCNTDDSDVVVLDLEDNNLAGTLVDLSAPSLETLSLSTNQLFGSIPDFTVLSLINLILGENQLTGTIPDTLLDMPLETIEVQSNKLFGPVPNFDEISSLVQFDISDNYFYGSLPNFSNFGTQLTTINAENNQFTGTISNFVVSSSIEYLNLANNQLTGTIPDFSGRSLDDLVNVYLQNNQLSGSLPDFESMSLVELNVSNNNLCGELPEEVSSTLTLIDVSGNTFLNPAPDWCTGCATFDDYFSNPLIDTTWSIYYNGCVTWNAHLLTCDYSDVGTFTFLAGGEEFVIGTDVSLDDGELNWVIHGVPPSTNVIVKYVPSDAPLVEFSTEPFILELDVLTGTDNPCSSI